MSSIDVRHPPAAPATPGPIAAAIDGAGWGLFFIWVGVCLLADLGWAVFFLGTGALMVAGQAARRSCGLAVDRFAVFLGCGFVLAALARLLELRWEWAVLPPWAAPALLIAVGAALVVLAWRRGRGS